MGSGNRHADGAADAKMESMRTRYLNLLLLKCLALFAVTSVTARQAETTGEGTLTLEMLYHPDRKVDLDGSAPRITDWFNDHRHYLQNRRSDQRVQQLIKTHAQSGRETPLYDPERLQENFAGLSTVDGKTAANLLRQGQLDLSPDESRVLISHGGDLFLYRLDTQEASRLTRTKEREREAHFSPDDSKLAFVRDQDLHVVDLASGSEARLTWGGNEDLLNGVLDWVYQEEIYGRGDYQGYWWSPDSSRIAFLQLDESPVPEFTVIDHIPQHLKNEVTRYPKAGDPNPKPRVGVVSASGGETLWIDLSGYRPEDLLIVRVGWNNDGTEVILQAQNKEQTWLDLIAASPENGSCRRLLRETTPAWVNRLDAPYWLQDGSFLWSSERTGWRHLYRYSSQGELLGAVTSGDWEARQLHGVDEESGWVYFSGTRRSPIGLDLYRVKLDGSQISRLTQRPGSHRVRFNSDLSLFVDAWSDFNTPTQTRVHRADGHELRAVDSNPSHRLSQLRLTPPERIQVLTRDGFTLEALLIKPVDFDPSRRYPVMSHVYGGPHAPRVVNRWGGTTYLWHQYLAQQGYLIWICDNRTASGKGAQSTWPAYRKLGETELRDLEDGLDWLKNQPWVDSSRIGLWGWSYGGYMTSYALTHSSRFKIGIAGAPVTDWRLYDTIYTERYMGTPQGNPEGYDKSSVLKAAGNLRGKLLLLHGTIDDNVHLQNTMQLIHELQKADKQFELMLFPGSRHGVRSPQQVWHLRQLMTRFILDNL